MSNKPKLSTFGARRALNYIRDIAIGRKDVVTFYRDSEGVIRELGTRKEIGVEPPHDSAASDCRDSSGQ